MTAITGARHVCSICGYLTDNRHSFASHRGRMHPERGSRRFVVELGCGHSYAALFAADRPCPVEAGGRSRCEICRYDATVRRVS